MSAEQANEAAAKKGKRRRPYVKPTFISEKIFETTALACGKTPGGSGVCGAVPKAS